MCNTHIAGRVTLRDVVDGDIEHFFWHQDDPEASRMAAFPIRSRAAHVAHWRTILADPSVAKQTIVFGDQVAGNVVAWGPNDEREVGYWLGREFWGNGIATAALRLFLRHETQRPLNAHVAKHNLGSIRVLEKCGFIEIADPHAAPEPGEQDSEEVLMRLLGESDG